MNYNHYSFTTNLVKANRHQFSWSTKDLQKLCDLARISASSSTSNERQEAELRIEEDEALNDWSIVYAKVRDEDAQLILKVTRSIDHLTIGWNGTSIVLRTAVTMSSCHLVEDRLACLVELCHSDSLFRLRPGEFQTWVLGSIPELISVLNGKILSVMVHVEQFDPLMGKMNEEERIISSKDKLAEDLFELLEHKGSSGTSDFQVSVGSKTFYLHKVILAARSPVINKMLISGMSSADVSKIITEDCSEKTIELALRFIYKGRLSFNENYSTHTCHQLLAFATKWGLSGLKDTVDRIFIKMRLTQENAHQLLTLTDSYGLKVDIVK